MNNQWLSFQSFVQNQELLEAINTLSIHTKLDLAGDVDEERVNKLNDAKIKIAQFIKNFDKIIKQTDNNKPILGVDHRLRQLVQNFFSAKQTGYKFHSPFFTESPARVLDLIKSENEEDKKSLIECLKELRILIEEHVHTDTNEILGEF